MSLITILIIVLVVGVIFYIIGLVPMPDTFRKIAYAVLLLLFVLFLLQALGLWSGGLRL